MTSKIFRNSFLVGVAVFFLSIALFMGVLYHLDRRRRHCPL